MKRVKLNITRHTKALLFVASLFTFGGAFAKTGAQSATLAFAPLALVAGMKKKGVELSEEETPLVKGLEDGLNEWATKEFASFQSKEDFDTAFEAKKADLLKSVSLKSIIVSGEGDTARTLHDVLKEQGDQMAALKAGGAPQNEGTFEQQLEKALKETIPRLKAMKATAGETPYEVFMTVKAPVAMNTGNVTNNASGQTVPISYVYQQVTDYAPDVRQNEYIINFLNNGTTDKAALPYMDKLPTEGTMAITAEGALKPLLSVMFELRYSTAFKIAGRSKLSEEALDDIPNIMAIIRNELQFSHAIAEQNAIFARVAAFAPGFVAGGMAASTDDPSNYDAIRAAIYAIKIVSKGMYMPNAVLVKSADAYNMGATKDTTGQYVFPPFVMPDGTTISGVRVIEVTDDVNIPDGTFIVGDWRKLKRRVYKAFTVRIGQGINNLTGSTQSDFETNMYTMLGESRLHLYINENEKTAFIRATFASVKTAIAAA